MQPRVILVIDDEAIVPIFFQTVFPDAVILTASSGVAGIDLLAQRRSARLPVDVIVLDLTMEGLNGSETCARLRSLSKTTPIVPYTAVNLEANATTRELLREFGCAPPLRKGIHPRMVAQRIEEALAIPPDVQGSAALAQLQHDAADREWQLRQEGNRRRRLVLFAPNILDQLALKPLIESSGARVVFSTATEGELRQALAQTPDAILVAPGSEGAFAIQIAHELTLPALIVARSPLEGLRIHSQGAVPNGRAAPSVGIVVAHTQMLTSVSDALGQLADGECYADPVLERAQNDAVAVAAAHLRARFDDSTITLTVDELAFLLVEAQDLDEEDMERVLGKQRDAIYKMRSRLRQKLRCSTAALRRLGHELEHHVQVAP
jgi:CheY-like chemotaxis protein